jgi:ATP-dependent DNA ligase
VAHYLDLLWLEAQDVRGLELIGRRRMLQKALRKAEDALRFSEHLSCRVLGERLRRVRRDHRCIIVRVA